MKTTLAKKETVSHEWKIVDASGQILGRLAVQIANALRGRNKPTYTPHVDTGDYVIVTNANKVKLSGPKKTKKNTCFTLGIWVMKNIGLLLISEKTDLSSLLPMR